MKPAPGTPITREQRLDLVVRIAALPPGLRAILDDQWRSSSLAGKQLVDLTGNYVSYASSLVAEQERMAERAGIDLAAARAEALQWFEAHPDPVAR
jgi:hypothetical protein